MFNLSYGMSGGVTYSCIRKMRKRTFNQYLKLLVKQKKRENEEMEKARKKAKKTKSGKFKYLGK